MMALDDTDRPDIVRIAGEAEIDENNRLWIRGELGAAGAVFGVPAGRVVRTAVKQPSVWQCVVIGLPCPWDGPIGVAAEGRLGVLDAARGEFILSDLEWVERTDPAAYRLRTGGDAMRDYVRREVEGLRTNPDIPPLDRKELLEQAERW